MMFVNCEALGAFVAAAVGGVDPSTHPTGDRAAVRTACALGVLLFMNFKFLVVDVKFAAPFENELC